MKPKILHFVVILLCYHIVIYSQENKTPNTLLLEASLHGNVQEIKKAIQLGADVNSKNNNGDTPLNMVAKLSYYKLVKYFIELGADVNTSNNDKLSPLHWGVEYNNVKIVKILLENGANVDARDSINETPLHYAGWTGNYESAKLLLKYGANPYANNNTGVTPLDLTIRQEHKKVEKLFQKARFRKLKG
ncbi:ankyrin repeat domain-containing protein [Flavobacterium sedimenticola]|uniref:Ankyrin repeat domain-containing protein n=1 Tax=Flavobacterium sedimenticola TaxID=3043286 RepID=A0ABT6XS24_9FLAO|nr:ankyrin repeat domain-containing protein [Flavobacterium sedimenticola]MDI9257890.1 ankyrin repeat domain-containing protein [Flavobacterium sedimenticola]